MTTMIKLNECATASTYTFKSCGLNVLNEHSNGEAHDERISKTIVHQDLGTRLHGSVLDCLYILSMQWSRMQRAKACGIAGYATSPDSRQGPTNTGGLLLLWKDLSPIHSAVVVLSR